MCATRLYANIKVPSFRETLELVLSFWYLNPLDQGKELLLAQLLFQEIHEGCGSANNSVQHSE